MTTITRHSRAIRLTVVLQKIFFWKQYSCKKTCYSTQKNELRLPSGHSILSLQSSLHIGVTISKGYTIQGRQNYQNLIKMTSKTASVLVKSISTHSASLRNFCLQPLHSIHPLYTSSYESKKNTHL